MDNVHKFREAEEEEERKFQAKRFLKGISLKEQNRSRGRKGIFRSRRKSGDSHMSQSSSYMERMKIPRYVYICMYVCYSCIVQISMYNE